MKKLRGEDGSHVDAKTPTRIKRSMNKASIQRCSSKRHIDDIDDIVTHVCRMLHELQVSELTWL